MKYYVFKTNIGTRQKVEEIHSIFETNPVIDDWNVDTNDVDNILRIRQSIQLKENDVINLVKSHGFLCEILPD